MSYNLIPLSKENDLNRELRKQKKDRNEISILFVSKWDKYSTVLLKKLEKKYRKSEDRATPLFIVDNYNMPHSFVIFKSTVLPQLVTLKRNKVSAVDYLPTVYRILNLE